jgi:hypothetical protein
MSNAAASEELVDRGAIAGARGRDQGMVVGRHCLTRYHRSTCCASDGREPGAERR